jgi:PadR family transcriptional regulator
MTTTRPRITLPVLRILRALLEDPTAAWYGPELAKVAELKSGTIYPALARLEAAGWLSSAWEDVDPSEAGRPRRRLYRLTGEGEVAARHAVEEQLARITPDARRHAPYWHPRPVRQAS